MVFFLFARSLSLIPIFPAISFIFSLINNSSQFVLGLISSFCEFSSECFLPGEIRIGFHQDLEGLANASKYFQIAAPKLDKVWKKSKESGIGLHWQFTVHAAAE